MSPDDSEVPAFTIFGVGDAGELNDQSRAVMKSLAEATSGIVQPSMVLYLGDNIYPSGMPPPGMIEEYLHSQDILMNQIHAFENYAGRMIFMPGNHDWNEFKVGGLASIRRQGTFLDSLKDPRIDMLPAEGCGDPVGINITANTTLIIFDSQWWIQRWEKEEEMNKGCDIDSREEFVQSFRDIIDQHKGNQFIVAMHHPLRSFGPHGGYFTVRDHLFPLSKVVPWLYLPLPVIGSVYPVYRSFFGHPQDVKHKGYQSLKERIMEEVKDQPEVVFLSGHDHSLQYSTDGVHHHIISGSASKSNAVASHRDLVYGHKAAGFTQLDIYPGRIRLTVYEIDPVTGIKNKVFNRFIVDHTAQ